MVKLRNYQQQAIDSVWSALQRKDNALVHAPTGAGKSEIFIHFLKKLHEKQSLKTCVLMERIDLVKQTANRFLKSGLHVGIYCGSLGVKNLSQPITVASIQSIPKDVKFDLVIIDEAHHLDHEKGRYKKFLENANKIVGFTATPYRQSGYIYGGEDTLFDELDFTISMQELIQQGFLVKPIAKRPDNQFDVSELHTRAGEYVQEELQALTADDIKVRAQVKEALVRLEGRKKIAWQCVSIDHAMKIQELIESRGESAACVHSNLEWDERTKELRSFVEGSSRHMSFVTILSEGFDHPPIDAIVLMRPTRSPVLYVQTVGRGLRPFEGKENCLILDFGKIVENLGPLDSPVIKKAGKGNKQDNNTPPVKFCPACLSYLPINKMECGDCGHVFEKQELKNLTHKPAEMELLSKPEEFRATQVELSEFISKKGNPCVCLSYGSGFNEISEYFVTSEEWGSRKLNRRLFELGLHVEKYPSSFRGKWEITYKKDGRFFRIIEARKSDRERDIKLVESTA